MRGGNTCWNLCLATTRVVHKLKLEDEPESAEPKRIPNARFHSRMEHSLQDNEWRLMPSLYNTLLSLGMTSPVLLLNTL